MKTLEIECISIRHSVYGRDMGQKVTVPCSVHQRQKAAIYCERDGPRLAVEQHFARVPRPRAPSQMPKKVPSIFSKTFSYQQRLIFMMDDLSWEESLPVFRESSHQVRKYRHMFTHFHIKCFYFHEFNFNLWTVESLDWHSLRKTEIIWTPRVSPWVGGGEGGGHLHVLQDPDISEDLYGLSCGDKTHNGPSQTLFRNLHSRN